MHRAQAELSGSGAASVEQRLHATRTGAGAHGQLRVSDEKAVPRSQLLSYGLIPVSSGADRRSPAFDGGGSIVRRHDTSILWLHK